MGCLVAIVFWSGVYLAFTGRVYFGLLLLGVAGGVSFVASLDD